MVGHESTYDIYSHGKIKLLMVKQNTDQRMGTGTSSVYERYIQIQNNFATFTSFQIKTSSKQTFHSFQLHESSFQNTQTCQTLDISNVRSPTKMNKQNKSFYQKQEENPSSQLPLKGISDPWRKPLAKNNGQTPTIDISIKTSPLEMQEKTHISSLKIT